MRLGIDDTDSPRGGCTTWVLTELVRVARRHDLDLLGEPRLVRLNPNIPWKTRGNAALSMRVGRGFGLPRRVGVIDGTDVVAFPRGREPPADVVARFVEDAWARVLEVSPSDRGTDPALVAVRDPLPEEVYWQTVRDLVRIPAAERAVRRAGGEMRVRRGRRGLIGAAAAVAWPARRATWEAIAYRRPERIGSPREVDPASVITAQRRTEALFLCFDARTDRLLVAPHTACPILFGLRGTERSAPLSALPTIGSEPVDRWMLFRTNQGTGDHLLPRRIPEVRGYRSAIVTATVERPPQVLPGGHVRFVVRDPAGNRLPCVAFEPTKTLPAVARDLGPGDRVRVWGARGHTGALQLEGIALLQPLGRGRWRAPACPDCGRRTSSLGTGRGWRCERCRRRLPPEAGTWAKRRREFGRGTYHPTPSARRHLALLAA